MAAVPLVEVQSSRTQRPTAGTSYPYVDLTLGDMNTQRVIQLQLEQVLRKHRRGPSLEATRDHLPCRAEESLRYCAHVAAVCPQGMELCRVIAMQVENMMSVRERRLTLPPSELTML